MRGSVWGVDFAGSVRSGSMARTLVKSRRRRIFLLVSVGVLWVGAIVARLASVQITNFELWQEWAVKQHLSEVTISSERGPISDRNGKLLAVSVPAGSVYVRPKLISDKPYAIRTLASALDMSEREVKKKLDSTAPFVWIKRQLPRVHAERVKALNIKGVDYLVESRRFYPYNESGSALIGRVGVDGTGLSGVEALYEKDLHSPHYRATVTRDALGNQIQLVHNSEGQFDLPRGKPLQLTLDAEIQVIMDQEVQVGQKDANAKAVLAVMVDSDTGEILGMSQSTSANFNLDKAPSPKALHNLLVEAVFEPGSIMKPMVVAAVLDAGLATPSEILNCEGGKYRVGKYTVNDVHPYGAISLYDVLVRSSNIGMTKLGMRMGADRLHASLQKFGFGEGSTLGLSGESRGILRGAKNWALIDVATHSFGQGVAVTPLQVVRAVSAIANGGTLPELQLYSAQLDQAKTRRVISDRTAATVRNMMFGVVEDEHGTGKNARIEGVRVGGKTGTAQKARVGGRGYADGLYVASFVGFAEADSLGIDKKLTLMVMVDEPNSGSIYGGTLAAPVFKRIMQRSLHYLSTVPSELPRAPKMQRKPAMQPGLTQVAYIP